MSNLNQTALGPVNLERTLGMPSEGPKCVPIALDFTTITELRLDYQNMQARNFLSMVQTLWVDNFASAVVMTITVPATSQVLKIPAGVQGYFPVLVPNPVKIIFQSTGAVALQVTLCNFPVLT
jgi:hypothetical protein